ncbi:MAG: hypothetical protein AUG47_05410 [Alphaproteobacteria bacterium 13_1_20CM_3_64_12]|jgi:hypothetical protein|nr:MAG: hypothetical protein AUG47_05410 [Alphaproteobacteria bacterium 13_1_20CM_3_64_12]
MKCEPIEARRAMVVRAGLRARTILRREVVARRTWEVACFATRARAVVARAGFDRRTVLRIGRFTALRARCMLRLAAGRRFATGRRLAATVRRLAAGRRLATVRRFTDIVRLAAVFRRAGLARRIVLRAVVFARTARRVREGFFAVRDRDVRDLLNIVNLPTWLKVRRS